MRIMTEPSDPAGPRPRRHRSRPPLTPGLRRLWRIGGTLWVMVLLPLGALQVAAVLAHSQETVVTSYPAAGLATVEVDNANGSVTVLGTRADEVRVTAHISHGWAHTRNEQEVDGDRLIVHSDCPPLVSPFCSVSYTVEVPAGLTVDAAADNGSVTASDLRGTVTLTSDNGRVEATRLSGDATLSSDNGRVVATDLESPGVAADSDNGRVELTFAAPPRAVTAQSDNGSVDVAVPDDSTVYRVDVGSDNGSATALVDQSRNSTRTITAQSDNGSVSVRYAP
jgi:hypothetical protein